MQLSASDYHYLIRLFWRNRDSMAFYKRRDPEATEECYQEQNKIIGALLNGGHTGRIPTLGELVRKATP